MKLFRKFCDDHGFPPGPYFASLVSGFLGALCCLFCQVAGQFREFAEFGLFFMMAPVLVVALSSEGSHTKRFGTICVGFITAFFCAMIPGALVGVSLGAWLG